MVAILSTGILSAGTYLNYFKKTELKFWFSCLISLKQIFFISHPKVSGVSGMVSVLIVFIVDSYSWKIPKVLIGECLRQVLWVNRVTLLHPDKEPTDSDRDRALPTSVDHCLALPDRSKGQNGVYSAIERRRLFSLLPSGTQGGSTKVVALSTQI